MRARNRAFLLVVVTALAPLGCKKPGDAASTTKRSVPPIAVQTVVADQTSTPDVLTLTGTVAADQRSDVTADTQGKVINVMIERGQRVKIGQPVVQLDVRNAALSAREAQANLEAARAQKQLAEQECARTKSLLDKGAITQSDFDKQSTECTSTLQQVAAAQARTEMTAKSVSDGLVRAPFDGLVSERMISPGEWVAPGKALFTLVKDDPLKIELSVPEAAVSEVQLGEHVELAAVARPDKLYNATVNRIGAEIGKSTRSLTVEARLDPGSDLVPGMFAEAHLVIGHTPRVVLPATAVVKRGKQWHAFVVDKNGTAQDRLVALAAPPAPGQVAIASSNIAKGEKVVAQVPNALDDGAPVTEQAGQAAVPPGSGSSAGSK
jgi:membrane fusion protein (multidrug efflux system)